MPELAARRYISGADERALSDTQRISRENVDMSKTESNWRPRPPRPTAGQALEIKDTRTGTGYTVPILPQGTEGDTAIRALDLRRIKERPDEFGLMTYDPAFMNTASCKSAITFIDGDKGILRYRGYPIEQLAEKASFLEVAWLLRNGELPTQSEYDDWVHQITYHTYVHENIKTFLQGFRYDAHPMSMLCSTVAALSSFYPAAKNIQDPEERHISIVRLLAKVPTLAAFFFRHVKGLPFIYPDNELGYVENFLSMVARMTEPKYEGEPGVREGARGAVHPARRPRAELLDERGPRRRQLAGRPVLGGGGGHRGALRPAARRRERAGAAHDQGDRRQEEHPRLHRGGEGRQGPEASWASATACTRATIRAPRS